MEDTFRLALVTLCDRYAAAVDVSPSAIGRDALNDSTFFGRIANPSVTFTVRTYSKLVQWFSDRWPAAVEWPATVHRPDTRGAEVSAQAEIAA